ncbi:MAG: isoprenylcysteine carboxylmethyltransferase family protein [Chloroflexi bacterium]|nr:isoprenylcysteine carboxylmethyltransferase family protein [Chloroflexota bacterium]
MPARRLSDRLPDLGPRGEGWVVLQFVLLAVVALAGTRGPDWGEPWRTVGLVAGAVLLATGLVLGVLGLIHLRPANLTAVPHPRTGGWLVETGVYGLVRHPVYAGLIAAAVGWSLVSASLAALAASLALGLFFDLKARREERWLATAYPDYEEYQRRVRRLVPFVY